MPISDGLTSFKLVYFFLLDFKTISKVLVAIEHNCRLAFYWNLFFFIMGVVFISRIGNPVAFHFLYGNLLKIGSYFAK